MSIQLLGALALNDVHLSEDVIPGARYAVDDFARIHVTPEDGTLVEVRDNDDVLAVCIGYFDQPIAQARRISLDSVITHYREFGTLPEADLFGSLQFILVDKAQRRAYLGTDRGGQRNVYCRQLNDVLYFSNKVHLLRNIANNPVAPPNLKDRDFALVYGFYPAGSTVYEGVRRLDKDCYFLIEPERVAPVQPKMERPSPEVDYTDEAAVVGKLYQTLNRVIESQTEGVDRVAVLLGGFDSALIASMLRSLGKSVETFTFRFQDPQFNQAHTDTLSRFLGIRHNWIDIDSGVFRQKMHSYRAVFDQPTNWVNYVLQSLHAVEAIEKRGFDLCLTGDGCDTLFQGYPGVNRSARVYNRLAPMIGGRAGLLIGLLNRGWMERRLGHVYRLVMRIIRNAAIDNPLRTFLMYRVFDETSLARLFEGESLDAVTARVEESRKRVAATIPRGLSLGQLAYGGRANMGPNRTKLSGAMDETGIRLLSPFMHCDLKSMVSELPDELLRPETSGNGMADIGKYILTTMAERYGLLPSEVIYQPKQAPVNSPIDAWYRSELSELARDILQRSPWKLDERFVDALVKRKWPEEMYKKYVSADQVTSHALSLLLTTLAFYED